MNGFEAAPGGLEEPCPGRFGPIAELDRVTIGCEIEGDAGETIPSGSSGTVVAIWADGAAYEVEFVNPVSALATVKSDAISVHHPRPPR